MIFENYITAISTGDDCVIQTFNKDMTTSYWGASYEALGAIVDKYDVGIWKIKSFKE